MPDAKRPEFSAEQLQEVRRLQALYPDKQGALLPVLRLAQEAFGYVSLEVEEYVAGLFEMSPAHVHEVVTFYTLFFQQPTGRHVVSVCHNLSCHLLGAKAIVEHLTAAPGRRGRRDHRGRPRHPAHGGMPLRVRAGAHDAGGRALRGAAHAGEGGPHPGRALLMAEKIFTRNFDRPNSHTLGVYRETGGYTALPKAHADGAHRHHRGGQEVQPPRPRRRRPSPPA